MDKISIAGKMWAFSLLFSFVFGPVLTAVLPTVLENPHGFIPLLGRNGTNAKGSRAAQYYISPHKASWIQAKRDCADSGFKLLTIKSSEIQSDIEIELMLAGITDQYVYTSGNDIQIEGTPVWGDGSRFIYQNHICSVNSATYDCMAIDRLASEGQPSWSWHFTACTNSYKFICEV